MVIANDQHLGGFGLRRSASQTARPCRCMVGLSRWLPDFVTSGRVGGNGKYGSLLDCSARGVRSARFASLAGGYTATGASAGGTRKPIPAIASGFSGYTV